MKPWIVGKVKRFTSTLLVLAFALVAEQDMNCTWPPYYSNRIRETHGAMAAES
jgi:hypothetical protein